MSSVSGDIFRSLGDLCIGVLLISVCGECSGCVRVIAGTLPGTLLQVILWWTCLVDLSARLVLGLGAVMIGGVFDICWILGAGFMCVVLGPPFVESLEPPFEGRAYALLGAHVGGCRLVASMRGMGL